MSISLKPKKKRRLSRKQEQSVMDKLGGRVQPNSGAIPGLKGDGRVRDELRVEMKYTLNDTYRLSIFDLFKIAGECTGTERPLFVLDFKEKNTSRLRGRFAIVPFEDWEKLRNAASNNK